MAPSFAPSWQPVRLIQKTCRCAQDRGEESPAATNPPIRMRPRLRTAQNPSTQQDPAGEIRRGFCLSGIIDLHADQLRFVASLVGNSGMHLCKAVDPYRTVRAARTRSSAENLSRVKTRVCSRCPANFPKGSGRIRSRDRARFRFANPLSHALPRSAEGANTRGFRSFVTVGANPCTLCGIEGVAHAASQRRPIES
jgi:hypothetical protein